MPSLDDLDFQEYKPHLFPKSKTIEGRSPYAHTPTDGPSFIPPQDRRAPLVSSGVFKEKYGKFGKDISPLLGVEYSDQFQIADVINTFLDEKSSPEAREEARNVIRDIAIEISRRGVVAFRHQHKLSVQNQKDFIDQLGVLSGRPKANGLHIHPRSPARGILGEDGLIESEVLLVTSNLRAKNTGEKGKYSFGNGVGNLPLYASSGWHSDITFEPVPAAYTALKIVQQPDEGSGGDTLFANGYALYERFSKPFQTFLEGLTGKYAQPQFAKAAEADGSYLYSDQRGAPENVGLILESTQPVIRTNPVTGWKSIYGVGHHFDGFKELSAIESANVQKFINDTLINSHDLQIRISWTSNSDIVIWDNRSTYHTATADYLGTRRGIRTISIGERPYLDENSGVQSTAIYKEIEERTGASLANK